MRKILMGLTVLTGLAAAASAANAAPKFVAPMPMASGAATVQPVHYYEDWRYREWRRRQAFERFGRHQEWRHERREAREHWRRGW